MKDYTTLAKVVNGKLVLEFPDTLKEWIKRQPENKDLVLSIQPYKKRRSLDQNAYYWTCLNIISDELGYSKEDVHELLKIRFLGSETLKIGDDTYTIPKTSTKLSTSEFKEYMDQVHQLAATMGIYLPDPSEHYPTR